MAQTPGTERPGTERPGTERTDTQNDFRLAVADSTVVILGISVLGLGLGVVLSAHHMPFWTAPLISSLVYAGSVEFLMVGMISGGVSIASIALTVFLVNARHLVYGLSYPLHRIKGFWAKLFAIHTLCDEAFALNSGPDRNERSGARILGVNALIYVSWILSVILGYVLGASFLSELKGVDFVMTALFAVLAIDAYQSSKDHTTAAIAGVSAAVGLVLAPQSMLLISMVVYLLLLVSRFVVAKRRGSLPDHMLVADEEASESPSS